MADTFSDLIGVKSLKKLAEHGSHCHAALFFSMTLPTEILSTETLDFLKEIIFLKSFNSMLYVHVKKKRQSYVYEYVTHIVVRVCCVHEVLTGILQECVLY